MNSFNSISIIQLNDKCLISGGAPLTRVPEMDCVEQQQYVICIRHETQAEFILHLLTDNNVRSPFQTQLSVSDRYMEISSCIWKSKQIQGERRTDIIRTISVLKVRHDRSSQQLILGKNVHLAETICYKCILCMTLPHMFAESRRCIINLSEVCRITLWIEKHPKCFFYYCPIR